ncbi:MAG TPA: LytTR family transcriptional regulator DNA-binding domain-containing protein [Rhizomicrobium sp.]|jgi:DNA-binding LytR/AlgR family response regulator|nr:LytTR family transcriptional regulator DNA-binding domain-containing protein [Rhizomicrobium sp.]
MTDTAPTAFRRAGVAREVALGFVYWLALVVVLEPGNALRGATLPLGWEAMRLVAAGLLGATITPAVFALTRRFPIEGEARWWRAAIHGAGDAGLAVGLIVAAGVLAAGLGFDRRPLAAALLDQLEVDGLLLFFAVAALTGIAHAVLFYRRAQSAIAPPETPVSGYLTLVPVKARGRVTMLEIARIDWIESQGNYLALHAGSETHLIRETSARFESLLDPARFVRVHRQSIVALDRIHAITSLPSGDATVEMADGAQVRMSRSYRDAVKARFEARGP